MRSTMVAVLWMLAGSALAQWDLSKVEVKSEPVAGNVHVIIGAGGNIGVSVGPDGALLVDDQFAPLEPKIEAAVKALTGNPLRFVLNTHFHGDHTGSNAILGAKVPIIAHENVRARLSTQGTDRGPPTPAPKEALPVITYADGLSLWLNGEEVRVFHVPHGHTDGDSVIWFTGSKVVHLGDDYFNGMFPFVDRKSGGSVAGYIAGLKLVLAKVPADAKFIPGHGAVSDAQGVRDFLKVLEDTRAAVQAGISKKKTLAQLQQEKVLGKWAKYASDFVPLEAFTELLYTELTAK